MGGGTIGPDNTPRSNAALEPRGAWAGLHRLLALKAPDAISLHTTDGTFLYASLAFAEILGWDPAELLGSSVYELVHLEDLVELEASHSPGRDGSETTTVQYRMRRPDGTHCWVETTSRVTRSPTGAPVMIWSTRDISSRQSALAEVEEERAYNERLTQLDEERATFLRAVAHEARTPLTALIGFSRLLRDRPDLTEDQRQLLADRVHLSAERLRALVEEVTEADALARRATVLRRTAVDVRELVSAVVDELARPDSVVHVEIGTPTLVFSDRERLTLALRALLENAVTHTPVGTPIWVRVQRTTEGVTVVVEDAGPGVPDVLKDQIFEPFVQGPTPSHNPGIGLGLHIVASVAAAHGGRAWIEDRAGGGARFVMLLPVRGSAARAPDHDVPTRQETGAATLTP